MPIANGFPIGAPARIEEDDESDHAEREAGHRDPRNAAAVDDGGEHRRPNRHRAGQQRREPRADVLFGEKDRAVAGSQQEQCEQQRGEPLPRSERVGGAIPARRRERE